MLNTEAQRRGDTEEIGSEIVFGKSEVIAINRIAKTAKRFVFVSRLKNLIRHEAILILNRLPRLPCKFILSGLAKTSAGFQ